MLNAIGVQAGNGFIGYRMVCVKLVQGEVADRGETSAPPPPADWLKL